jgi:hypothetical protein
MIRFFKTVTMVIVVLAAVLMALPEARPAYALDVGPCTNDFQQYCSDVTPGGGRLVRCYEERKDKMSIECIGWAEGAKANAAALKAACAKEIDAGCNFWQGDPFGSIDCLQSNYINLSMGCRVQLNEFKGRYPKPLQ